MQWYYKEKAKCRKNKANMILCYYKQKCKTLFKCEAAVIVSKEKKASFNTERACSAILESLLWMQITARGFRLIISAREPQIYTCPVWIRKNSKFYSQIKFSEVPVSRKRTI